MLWNAVNTRGLEKIGLDGGVLKIVMNGKMAVWNEVFRVNLGRIQLWNCGSRGDKGNFSRSFADDGLKLICETAAKFFWK